MTQRGLFALALSAGGLAIAPAAEAADRSCAAAGQVLDVEGEPVPHLRIELQGEGASPRVIPTDADGRFVFADVSLDAGAPQVVIRLAYRQGDHDAFVLHRDHAPIELTATSGDCRFDLDLRGPAGYGSELPREDWADAVALYQGFARAWQLGAQLGVQSDPAAPLQIEAWQAAASPETSFWVGTASHLAKSPRTPLLGIGTAASRRGAPGAPDNREYHELGHHVLALALGALPRARADIAHGGYYRNPTSADAWAEGFATFFAMMVAARIEGRADPARFALAEASIDLELDYGPWDLGGLEELAVAGVLLDVVDGETAPADSAAPPSTVGSVSVETGGTEPIIVVQLEDLAPSARIARLSLRDEAGDERLGVRVDASVWRMVGDEAMRLPIAVPPGIAAGAIASAVWDGAGRPDDDPLQVELATLWASIVDFRSEQPESNGRLFDVADLHAALRPAFGGRDRDGDGVDDVDQIFVAHGLFADTDGDHVHGPTEAIGRTAHPARTLEVDGEATTWPAQLQRRRVPVPAGLRVRVQSPEIAPRLFVQTTWPTEMGRDVELAGAPLDAEGRVTLIAPPSGRGASVRLLADADEHRPAVVRAWDADVLHAVALEHTEPTLAVNVSLLRGGPGASRGLPEIDPRLLFVAGAASVGLGVILLGIGALRGRAAS